MCRPVIVYIGSLELVPRGLHTELFYHPYPVFLIFAIPTLVTFLMY